MKKIKKRVSCGAKTRAGTPCKRKDMLRGGRCRMHGGKSTGRPIIHGRNTKRKKKQFAEARRLLAALKDILSSL